MSRVALWAMCALVFSIPVENVVIIPGVGSAARIVGYFAFAICIWYVLLRGRIRRLDGVHLICTFFVALSCLSIEWSFDPELTSTKVFTCIQLLVMMWLICEVAVGLAQQEMLMLSLVIGASVSAIGTFYSYKTGTAIVGTNRYVTDGFDPNDLALTFALVIPVSWYLSTHSLNPWIRMLCRCSVCLSFAGILLTGSRGGFMAGVAALLIIPALSKKRNLGTIALSLAAFLAVLLTVIPNQSWDRMFTIRDAVLTGTMTNRTDIWALALKQFYANPVLGVGAFAFSPAVGYRDFRGLNLVAHNTYLSVLVELGVVGFAAFAAILLSLWRRIWCLPKISRRLWGISLLTWCIGVSGLTWEHKKMTWLLFALIVAESSVYRRERLSHSGADCFADPG